MLRQVERRVALAQSEGPSGQLAYPDRDIAEYADTLHRPARGTYVPTVGYVRERGDGLFILRPAGLNHAALQVIDAVVRGGFPIGIEIEDVDDDHIHLVMEYLEQRVDMAGVLLEHAPNMLVLRPRADKAIRPTSRRS